MKKLLLIMLFTSSAFANYDDYQGQKSLNYQQLKYLIETSQADTVEKALKSLKEKNPEFFERYILMYRSRSLQQSSYLYPRALLVGPAAKLVISFNGDKKHRGYQNLEVMEFKDDEQRFEFRDIRFIKGKSAVFSQANPSKCMVCHQNAKRIKNDPRPNWEPYSLWPGAYGSDGDFKLNSSSIKYDDRIRKEDHQFLTDHLNEAKNYAKFATQVKPHHDRYRFLSDRFDSDLTVNFTDTLLTYAYRRVVRLAKKTPYYQQYKYAFASSVKCQKIPWSEEFEKWHTENNPRPARIRQSSVGTTISCEDSLRGGPGVVDEEVIERICRERKTQKPKYRSRHLSESLVDIFEPMGVDTSDWSTDFRTEGGRFAFRERFGIPTNPIAKMQGVLRDMEPELAKLSCKDLEQLSLASLSEFKKSGGFAEMKLNLQKELSKKPLPIMHTCAKCHGDASEAWIPQIPFTEPDKLRTFMQKNKFKRGRLIEEVVYRTGAHAVSADQMPPSQVLTGSERKELIEYLQGLLK